MAELAKTALERVIAPIIGRIFLDACLKNSRLVCNSSFPVLFFIVYSNYLDP